MAALGQVPFCSTPWAIQLWSVAYGSIQTVEDEGPAIRCHLPAPSRGGKVFGYVVYDVIATLKTRHTRLIGMLVPCFQLPSSPCDIPLAKLVSSFQTSDHKWTRDMTGDVECQLWDAGIGQMVMSTSPSVPSFFYALVIIFVNNHLAFKGSAHGKGPVHHF